MKIKEKRFTAAAAALSLCIFFAVTFTFAGKYIMISHGMAGNAGYKAQRTVESVGNLNRRLAEGVRRGAEKEFEAAFAENREGEFVFTFSVDDFIERYNSIYQADRGVLYFAPSWEWRSYNYDRAIHSGYACTYYHYSKDETILPFPTVSVYTPSGSDNVLEITLNFDDHSYTDPLYKAYEDMCFYTLKTLLPDLAEDEIVTLYKTLNDLAYEHLTPIKYTAKSAPCAVYCRGNVALYPYFAIGESLHLCIIPAAGQYIEQMEQRGAQILQF